MALNKMYYKYYIL